MIRFRNIYIYTLLRFIDTIYIKNSLTYTIYIHHVITKYVFLAWFKLILLRGIGIITK